MNKKAMSDLGRALLLVAFLLIVISWLVYTYAPGILSSSQTGNCEQNTIYKDAKCVSTEQDCLNSQKDVIPGGAGCPKETPICCAKT